jgi:putative ABC transport system permease protein
MSHWLRLGFWLLRRERRAGEWRVLLLALAIGVGSIASIGFLGDRLQRALGERGANFLGADLVVTSPRPLTNWPAHTLQRSLAIDLITMVSHGERFQLADLRAVDAA